MRCSAFLMAILLLAFGGLEVRAQWSFDFSFPTMGPGSGPFDVEVDAVGNIYASEALFLAGINPLRAAGRVARQRYELLAEVIQQVLLRAIEAGGTTLRDFYGGDGAAGYFKQELAVYGREELPCIKCKRPVAAVVLGQRSTFYCKNCQS